MASSMSTNEYSYKELIGQYHDIYLTHTHNGKVYGKSSEDLLNKIAPIVREINPSTILDYGCGRSCLINYFWNDGKRKLYKYDPAINEYKHLPKENVDLIICTDVLEHVPEKHLRKLIKEIRDISKEALFTISMVKARAVLPNGANAHVTIENSNWWLDRFAKYDMNATVIEQTERELFLRTKH